MILDKVYTASDFIYEIKKITPKCKYSFQLFVSEVDFLKVSDSITELISKDVDVEIIISSANNKKSLRMLNIISRIIQSNGNIYWNLDKGLLDNDSHFIINDKTLIVNKSCFYNGEFAEEKIIFYNGFFDRLREDSESIKLFMEKININFWSNKTFIKKNTLATVYWEVENAFKISLENIQENVDSIGQIDVLIKNDTVLKLNAENLENKISKHLIFKIIKNTLVDISVEVFDLLLEDYITLKASDLNNNNYFAFRNQKVRISWSVNKKGEFNESQLGDLPLEGSHVFLLQKNHDFQFIFSSNNESKEIKFVINAVNETSFHSERASKKIFYKSAFREIFTALKNKLIK